MSFFPVNSPSKKNCAMRRGMKSPRSLKVCIYATCLIYFDKYLASFPVATMADKMGVNAFNETLLNIIPNS